MDLPKFSQAALFTVGGKGGTKGAALCKAGPGLRLTASVQPDSRRGVCQPRRARPNGSSAKRDTDCPDIAKYQPSATLTDQLLL